MADDKKKAQGPTVLVKKGDGTSVRMTLDEFRAYKKQQSAGQKSVNQPTKKTKSDQKKQEEQHTELIVAPEHELAVVKKEKKKPAKPKPAPKPAKRKAEKPAPLPKPPAPKKAHTWDSDDHLSLLEEEFQVDEQRHIQRKDESLEEIAKAVFAKLSFKIPEPLHKRVESLIRSRRKDVRTDYQLFEYAVQESTRGGLGLGEEQAKELVDHILEALHMSHEAFDKSMERKKQAKEMKEDMEAVPGALEKEAAIAKEILKRQAGAPTPKKMIHDIAPSEKRTRHHKKRHMGPVDEIRTFSLLDFRRLASTSQKATQLLGNKFATLRGESYLLFMQGRDAWHQSPLFLQYLDVIKLALNKKRTISETLTSNELKDPLSMDEFMSLVALNKQLRL